MVVVALHNFKNKKNNKFKKNKKNLMTPLGACETPSYTHMEERAKGRFTGDKRLVDDKSCYARPVE